MKVIKINGLQLAQLLQELEMVEHRSDGIHTLRVAFDEGGVKFKLNETVWSLPLGQEER
jgi:hypothetical protein